MLEAAFRLTGSVGLLFKKQMKVSLLRFKIQRALRARHSNKIKSLSRLFGDNVPLPSGTGWTNFYKEICIKSVATFL